MYKFAKVIASSGNKRSLYWRNVIGLSICIAAVLAVQVGAVVIWLQAPDQTLSAFTHGWRQNSATSSLRSPHSTSPPTSRSTIPIHARRCPSSRLPIGK